MNASSNKNLTPITTSYAIKILKMNRMVPSEQRIMINLESMGAIEINRRSQSELVLPICEEYRKCKLLAKCK
jgi:hypothetical protein